MKAFITNSLIRKINADGAISEKNLLVEACVEGGLLAAGQPLKLLFDWPAFLESIELGSLFWSFPSFEQSQLFNFMIAVLAQEEQKDELLIRLYDQVFVECLTQVKALPQIDQSFLLDQIQKKRRFALFSQAGYLFSAPLDHYERMLVENPYNTLHDLTLYLAWDRVCVNLAMIFENPSALKLSGLEVLKQCLVESFQHITGQGRTAPGFFRLIEAFYAFQMREENLQIHTDTEWLVLCQSAPALRPRDSLCDAVYIDESIINSQVIADPLSEMRKVKILTLDSVDKVKASLSLGRYMIEKLQKEVLDWGYALRSVEVICFREEKAGLAIESVFF
ncbi:hypothetical protein PNK_1305 [Candidatus Protochlamydia naegleriophila]|uniref:Uncharacterized protein n=1 Tax=Candidatus Protochlamydia naegleriophila TaxID=389348 RepID=A0A0U5JDN5_9BACT|nr:hypothetical protein [Candidatus Protochlamydia naegleriophila]CUI16922.1 hypothetical protein PNK_1305 [Candidatus Protochlamydia naegleriophila]